MCSAESVRRPGTLGVLNEIGGFFQHPSGLFDCYHFLPLIGTARQAGVMGKFRFVALGTNREPGRRNLFVGSPFITACSGEFMFRIRHVSPSLCFYHLSLEL